MKRQNADQNDDNRAECHHKVEKFHGVVSLSLGFLSIPSDHGLDLERVRKRGSAETWRSLWGCSFFRSGKCSCKTCTRLADRQVSGGLRRKKSNGKNGNKRKNGRRNGVQNHHDGSALRAGKARAGDLCETSGMHPVHGAAHGSVSFLRCLF